MEEDTAKEGRQSTYRNEEKIQRRDGRDEGGERDTFCTTYAWSHWGIEGSRGREEDSGVSKSKSYWFEEESWFDGWKGRHSRQPCKSIASSSRQIQKWNIEFPYHVSWMPSDWRPEYPTIYHDPCIERPTFHYSKSSILHAQPPTFKIYRFEESRGTEGFHQKACEMTASDCDLIRWFSVKQFL